MVFMLGKERKTKGTRAAQGMLPPRPEQSRKRGRRDKRATGPSKLSVRQNDAALNCKRVDQAETQGELFTDIRLDKKRPGYGSVLDVNREALDEHERVRKAYQTQIEGISFLDGFLYKHGLRPGPELMKLLGVKKRKGETQRSLRGALRMNIPDTVVISEHGRPAWLYTDAEGIVRRTTDFTGKQVVEQLGDLDFPSDAVAVLKVPRYHNTTTFRGSDTSVLDTSMLIKSLAEDAGLAINTDAFTSRSGHGTGYGGGGITQGTAGFASSYHTDDATMIYQRFVKGKGYRAHVTRTNWQYARSCSTWMLTNAYEFDNEALMPDEDKRLINDASHPFGVSICHVNQGAGKELEELTVGVKLHLEKAIGRRLIQLCVDSLRDDDGQLWFLGVQAYRLLDASIERPRNALLPPVLQTSITKGDFHLKPKTLFDSLESKEREQDDQDLPPILSIVPSASDAKVVPVGRKSPGSLKKCRCKFCSAFYPPDETNHVLTTQMILETSGLLQKVLGKDRFIRLFARQRSGDMGPDASRLYTAHFVCSHCYDVYDSCLKLQRACTAFSKALSVPNVTSQVVVRNIFRSPTSPASPEPANRNKNSDTGKRRMAVVKIDPSVFCSGGDGAIKAMMEEESALLEEEKREEFVATMPDGVTLCRIMVAIHEVHDLPEHLFDVTTGASGEESIRPLYDCMFRFQTLGKNFEIPVDLYQIERSSDSNGRIRSKVMVKEMRVFSFFSEDTPITGVLPRGAGLAQLIAEEPEIILRLCVRSKLDKCNRETGVAILDAESRPYEMLGKCHLPLLQFKSVLLKHTEMVMPLRFGSEFCEVRVSLGLERTRSNFNGDSIECVRFYKGVFVAPDTFFSVDPLPDEWILSVSNRANASFLQRNRESHRSFARRGSIMVERAQPSKLSVPSLSSSANAYCIQMSLAAARNLKPDRGWPRALYAQYKLFGKWYTTDIVLAEAAADGTHSFEFQYEYKHYVRFLEEEMAAELQKTESVEIIFFCPLTRCETLASMLIENISRSVGADCFPRQDFISALKAWEKCLVSYSKGESISAANKSKYRFPTYLLDICPNNSLPVRELAAHLELFWVEEDKASPASMPIKSGVAMTRLMEDSSSCGIISLPKDGSIVQPRLTLPADDSSTRFASGGHSAKVAHTKLTITPEEVLYTSLVILRLHLFYSELISLHVCDAIGHLSLLEKRVDWVLHPSNRKVIEPEMLDKVADLKRLFISRLREVDTAKRQSRDSDGVGFTWREYLGALAVAFRTVELNGVRELTILRGKDVLPHRIIMEAQTEDRVAYRCKISLASIIEEEESTIDGTFDVNALRMRHSRRDSYVSCYSEDNERAGSGNHNAFDLARERPSAKTGVTDRLASGSLDSSRGPGSSNLSSAYSESTCTFSSFEEEELDDKEKHGRATSTAATAVQAHLERQREKNEEQQREPSCPWEKIIRVDDDVAEHDVADLVCAVEALDEKTTQPEELAMMRKIVEHLYENEHDTASLVTLRRLESFLDGRKTSSARQDIEEDQLAEYGDDFDSDSKSFVDLNPQQKTLPAFPAYLHASFCVYKSVFISDPGTSRSNRNKISVTQTEGAKKLLGHQ